MSGLAQRRSALPSSIILGVDPGTQTTGYGVIEADGQALRALDFGAIRPPRKDSPQYRYLAIFDGVEELLKRFSPCALAVETQYVHKNVQSAMRLGMARGVILVAAARHQVPVFEYAPTKAKKAVGWGGASKAQVQGMVQRLLGLAELPEPEDAADALALAICHANTLKGVVHV